MQRFTDLKVWERSPAGLSARVNSRQSRVDRGSLWTVNRRLSTRGEASQDFARFLNLAESSLAEVEYLLMLSRDLGYLTPDRVEPLVAEVGEISRMIYALRGKVEQGAPE